MKKIILSILLLAIFTSCVSTKSTIKNIDDTTPGPGFNEKYNSFIITKNATDKKYGYNEDYPINVGFTSLNDGARNQVRFLSALAGPKGESLQFKLVDSCCPFPTKKTEMGAGTLDIFEITWLGQSKPIRLYINKFEKGELLIPVGFTARK